MSKLIENLTGYLPDAEFLIEQAAEMERYMSRPREPRAERLRSIAASMAWQPIETAPRDGSRILVSAPSGLHAVEWLIEGETDGGFDGWYVTDNKHGPFILRGHSPTHWRRLPPPPAA